MTIWTALALASFVVLVITGFFSFRRIRQHLIDRHTERFLELERKSWFPHRSLYLFVLWGDHKDLRDAELSREIRTYRWLTAGTFASWLAYAVTIAAAR